MNGIGLGIAVAIMLFFFLALARHVRDSVDPPLERGEKVPRWQRESRRADGRFQENAAWVVGAIIIALTIWAALRKK